MSSQKAEIVIETLNAFIEEMNLLISAARVMKKDIINYRTVILDAVDSTAKDKGCQISLQNAEEQTSKNEKLSITEELAEINSAVKSNRAFRDLGRSSESDLGEDELQEIAAKLVSPVKVEKQVSERIARGKSFAGSRSKVHPSSIPNGKKSLHSELDAPLAPKSLPHFWKTKARALGKLLEPIKETKSKASPVKLRRSLSEKKEPEIVWSLSPSISCNQKSPEKAEQRPLLHIHQIVRIWRMGRWWKEKACSHKKLNENEDLRPEETTDKNLITPTNASENIPKNAITKRSCELRIKTTADGSPVNAICDSIVSNCSDIFFPEHPKSSLLSAENTPRQRNFSIVSRMASTVQGRRRKASNAGCISFQNSQALEEELMNLAGTEYEHHTLMYSMVNTWTLPCHSTFYQIWELLVLLTTIYGVTVIPLVLGSSGNATDSLKIPSCLADSIYVLDILLKTRVTFYDDEFQEIRDPKKITRRYFQSSRIIIDLISAVPWGTLVFLSNTFPTEVNSFCVLRIAKLGGDRLRNHPISTLLSNLMSPAAMRMLKIVLVFFMIMHLYACLFMHSFGAQHFRGNWYRHFDDKSDSFMENYVKSLYFALALIAGNHLDPSGGLEYSYACFGLLLAFTVNAVIIGTATTVVSTLDINAQAKKKHLDDISDYLRYMKAPHQLKKKVLSYYSYLWETNRCGQGKTVLKDLPQKLQLEVNVIMNKRFIQGVPLLKALSPAGVIMVIKRLEPIIVLPEELIIQEGESAQVMFFLNRGIAEVFVNDKFQMPMYLATLRAGNFFGEVALLDQKQKRTASVKSKTFCELQTLRSECFQAVLNAFPQFRQAVKRIAEIRSNFTRNMKNLQHKNTRSNHGSLRSSPANLHSTAQALTTASRSLKTLRRASVLGKSKSEGSVEDTFYTAVLQNHGKITQAVASDAMQKQSISERDFINFERAVGSTPSLFSQSQKEGSVASNKKLNASKSWI